MITTSTALPNGTDERSFRDTAYWIALTSVHDAAHEAAERFEISLSPGTILTSESVLTEYLNYFAEWGAYFRPKVSANVQPMLSTQTEVTIALHTREMFLDGLELYRSRLDKGY
jgi:predicted nucleic acid-binding protein